MTPPKHIRTFLFGQHLADGMRVTLSIIAPALTGAMTGHFEAGMAASLGALCVSISDAPGPIRHKRTGMLYCLLFVVIMALATGLLNHYPFWMGVLIAGSVFFFSMFNVFGSRAASVGTGALLVMILRMSDLTTPAEVFADSFYILLGGLWYIVIAMTSHFIRPFRPIQRALGDSLNETANYLIIKADFYDPSKSLDETYSRLINQQTVVNEKQDIVRELLFKNRSILKESTFEGRSLVVTFSASVDLFEQIMAIWYDYHEMRKKYDGLGVLPAFNRAILSLADELHNIADSIHNQTRHESVLNVTEELNELKINIEKELGRPLDFTLRKILINLRNQGEKINVLSRYFKRDEKQLKSELNQNEYERFAPHQKINGTVFVNNLNLNSSAFRHSLRVMITCTVGFILAKLFFKGDHSYWIIMTIIIIMKPAYSLTKSKNIDRLTGTMAGGIIGLLILHFVKNDFVLFGLFTLFALGTYTTVRLNYVVMVLFLTPYVLILFHFLGKNIVNIAGERLLDTAIAGALAWLAMHFLFPNWEKHTIQNSLVSVLKANIRYLSKLCELTPDKTASPLAYKLVRKEVFVSTANLSAALHRMQSEPKGKQQHKQELYELVVLNHVLSSNIASLAKNMLSTQQEFPGSCTNQVNRSIRKLEDAIQLIEPGFQYVTEDIKPSTTDRNHETESQFKDQFSFVENLTADINRIARRIAGKPQNRVAPSLSSG